MAESFEREVVIGDRSFVMKSDDDYLRNIGDLFEPAMTKLYRALLEPGYNTLDVGANIGMTALLFAQLAAAVKAFEPSPSTFAFLLENVARSGCNNIEIFNFGLGAEDSDSELTHAPVNRSGGFVSNQTRASDGHVVEDVKIRKGDSLLRGSRVDFIKIDVEGFEMKVLEGLRSVLEDNQPIAVIELNHWCLNAFQRTSVPDFFDFLRSIFPKLYAVEENNYVDLFDQSGTYTVMYHHILHFRYSNLVGAFSSGQLASFFDEFSKLQPNQ